MDLKLRIKESIERKLGLDNITYNSTTGLLEPLSVFNTIRRMKIIERIFRKDYTKVIKNVDYLT